MTEILTLGKGRTARTLAIRSGTMRSARGKRLLEERIVCETVPDSRRYEQEEFVWPSAFLGQSAHRVCPDVTAFHVGSRVRD